MKKRYIVFIVIFILIATFTVGYKSLRADSGWDTDYDFGGGSSWDSGSSWGSSDWGSSDWGHSSWDSDYSYHGSNRSNGYNSDGDASFVVFGIVIIIVFVIIVTIKGQSITQGNTSSTNSTFDYTSDDVLKRIKEYIKDFDEQKFLDDGYQKFLDVQNAWMNFDFDKLRESLTDELFNTYNSQLKVLKAKKQKNVMDGFRLNNHRLASFNASNNEYTIKTYMNVAFYDYVIDKNEQVVRGNKYRKVVMTYELTFVRTVVQKENTCPNCHAPLPKNASNVCEYCKSTISSGSYNWVISKKQAINQNWER